MLYGYTYRGLKGGGFCAANKLELDRTLRNKLSELGAIGPTDSIHISAWVAHEGRDLLMDLSDVGISEDQDEINVVVQLIPDTVRNN